MLSKHLPSILVFCVFSLASTHACAQALAGEPTSDDLLARVSFENGEPVSGLRAQLQIKRTVGAFTGSGTPPITSTPSSQSGELRFPLSPNWRDWIKWELAARNPKKPASELDQADFRDFQWKLDGYWPQTNSRVEFLSSGKPALWRKDETIDFVIPQLHMARILVKSDRDQRPLANVRLRIQWEFRNRPQKRLWDDLLAYAWTDATGSAVVWLPKGDYRVYWDTTVATIGYTARSDLFLIQDSRFGQLPTAADPRNTMLDQARKAAFAPQSAFFNDYQPPLRVGDEAPEFYELPIQAPTLMLP